MALNIKDRKLVQILAYLANKDTANQINKLKAIKLVWVADRYHLRKYGRLVSGDEYYALKFGPVASQLKNIAEHDSFLSDAYISYASDFIRPSEDKQIINARQEADRDFLSKTDIEALEFAWDKFSSSTGFEIADFSHQYPEWLRYKDVLESGEVGRAEITLVDFFEDAKLADDPFSLDADILSGAKEVFIQNTDVERALTI